MADDFYIGPPRKATRKTKPRRAKKTRSMSGMKPTNPKDIIGSGKIPFHFWPHTATILGTLALTDGALKYGRTNWRAMGVLTSVYVDACLRHIFAYMEGEDCADDSEVPHLGHALACLAIIIDADAVGMLTDDRMISGGYHKLLKKWTPLIAKLKEKHADKNPRHYTINDSRIVRKKAS